MKSYTYCTSEKSYLDKKHDPYWDSLASLIAVSFPWITPNMITLAGVIPIFILFGLYIAQIITSVMIYSWLVPALIFYLNMDAIDGKLARLTNRSSPFGQMVDHGCDALALGCIIYMLLGHIDNMLLSYNYRILVFVAIICTYIAQLMCNITEFYTGGMVVSLGSISTTELIYTASIGSFILSRLYAFELESLPYLIQTTGSVIVIIVCLVFSYTFFKKLQKPLPDTIKLGTNNKVKPFSVSDIRNYVITMGLSSILVCASEFSISEMTFAIIYISASMVDIIFSNSIKRDTILFDDHLLMLQIVKCVSFLIFGFGYATTFIDSMCIARILFDKIKKRDYIFEKYMTNVSIK